MIYPKAIKNDSRITGDGDYAVQPSAVGLRSVALQSGSGTGATPPRPRLPARQRGGV